MENYIEKIEKSFGDWNDFQKIIEAQEYSNIKMDFMRIIAALPEDCIINFLEWVIKNGDLNLIIENISYILEYISQTKTTYKTWIEYLLDYLVSLNNLEINQSLSNHLIAILQGPYGRGNLWTIINIYNKYKNVGNSRVVIENNYDVLLKTLFSDNSYISNNNEVFEYIKKIIYDIAKKENVRLSDISSLDEGKDSKCLLIGNYVFKYGKGRILDELFDHRRIIKPLLRENIPQNFTDMIQLGKISSENVFAIEIQPFIEAEWYTNLSEMEIEEILYKIFSELKNNGIEWTDIKKENVGKKFDYNEDFDGFVIFDTQRIFSVDKVPEFEEWKLRDTLYKKFKDRFEIERENMNNKNNKI